MCLSSLPSYSATTGPEAPSESGHCFERRDADAIGLEML
jgi:hypothetical protein